MGGRLLLIVWAIIAWSTPAGACPICDSATGVEVRSHIIGDDLMTNLAVTVAPFVVTVVLIAGAHYVFTERDDRHRVGR